MLQIDGFHGVTKVGSGGLGDVHRAIRTSTGTDVAIKELRAESGHEASMRRANRELAALASLRGHPHVVNLEEVIPSPAGGGLLLVMEYSAAGSVADRADAAGAMLPVPEIVLIGEHAASALHSAHVNGIIHRDIKPQNLLIGPFGQVKVCDFGISSIAESEDFGTKTNAVSYRFASPEELRGDATITPKADIYSLGVSLAKLLTNRYFNFETAPHLLDMAATPGVVPGGPAELELRRLLVRCLAHQAAQRPNATVLGNEFESQAQQLGSDRCKQLTVAHRTRNAPAETSAAALVDPTPPSGPAAPSATAPPPTPQRAPEALATRRRIHPLWYVAIALWAAVAAIAAVVLAGGDDSGEGGGTPVAVAVEHATHDHQEQHPDGRSADVADRPQLE